MDLVALTDHDTIDGALELLSAHPGLPDDFIIGEEVSCRFPGTRPRGPPRRLRHDRGAASRAAAAARQRLRRHRAACARRTCSSRSITCCFFYRGQMPLDAYLRAARRGARRSRRATGRCCRRTTSGDGDRRRAGRRRDGRRRASACVGGSDAHTLRRVGTTWTEAPGRDARGVPRQPARGPRRARRRSTAAPPPSPAMPTASSARTSRASPASGRAITACAPRAAASRLLARVAARAVPAAGAGRGAARRANGETVAARLGRRRGVARRAAGGRVGTGARMTRRRVAITGIGLVTALGATREASWQRPARRRVRHPAGHACSTPRAIAAASPPKCRRADDRRAADAARAPPLVARRSHRRRWPPPRPSTMPGCSTARSIASRIGVFLGAGTARSAPQRAFYQHTTTTPRHRRTRGRRTPGITSRARRSTSSPAASASKVPAPASSPPARRARSRSARRRTRCDRGRADAALAGGTDALARLTFSGFNVLRLMDPEPCRPFDRSRAGMNIGEGAGILVLEELERARRRGARIYARARRPRVRAARPSIPTAPEPDGAPVPARSC